MNKDALAALIRRHRLLDVVIEHHRDQFLSDWNCNNPFFNKILGSKLLDLVPRRLASGGDYVYFDEEHSILEGIRDFHLKREKIDFSRCNVMAGPGSSSFLAAFSLWLRQSGYTDIYYLPPLYHTIHFLLDIVDMRVIPVSQKHAFEMDCVLSLPSHSTVLLLCDPIWYAGKPLPQKQVDIIAEWQRATRSIVFVDGSFQYMKWGGLRSEGTAVFDPELTFRLVCPAKTLAVPFFRFAYLLHPAAAHAELLFLYESIVGGASAADLAFAYRALEVLGSDADCQIMPNFFCEVFYRLIKRGLIRTKIIPECGYFVFAAPAGGPSSEMVMDQSYFELEGYPDYHRINLMSARRIYLYDEYSDTNQK